jgi:hypothetical protein
MTRSLHPLKLTNPSNLRVVPEVVRRWKPRGASVNYVAVAHLGMDASLF